MLTTAAEKSEDTQPAEQDSRGFGDHPLSPALRSGPTAASGASRQKQLPNSFMATQPDPHSPGPPARSAALTKKEIPFSQSRNQRCLVLGSTIATVTACRRLPISAQARAQHSLRHPACG